MNANGYGFARTCMVTIVVWGATSVGLAQQSTMQFPVARDNSIAGWNNHNGYGIPPEFDKFLETEEWSNFGAAELIRARKANQHAVIMDWDTDAISSFIAENVDTSQPMQWTLNIYPLAGPLDDIPVETLESLNDWSEGNGLGTFANFNWDPDTTASTTNFAQTAMVEDEDGDYVLDLENSLPWVDNDFGTGGIDDNQYAILEVNDNFSLGQRIPDFINGELFLADDLLDAADDGTYATVPLDDDLVDAILTDPVNRGIIFGSIPSYDNWQIHSRESGTVNEDERPGPFASFLELTYTPGGGGTPGDYNGDDVLDAADIDLQAVEMKKPQNEQDLAKFDHNGDGVVDVGIPGSNASRWGDRLIWIRSLRGTSVGDVNFDNVFDSGDLVLALQEAKYAVDAGNAPMATWVQGDWNGDMVFDSGDLVFAFQDGGYVAAAAPAVPEPSSLGLALLSVLGWIGVARRQRTNDCIQRP